MTERDLLKIIDDALIAHNKKTYSDVDGYTCYVSISGTICVVPRNDELPTQHFNLKEEVK